MVGENATIRLPTGFMQLETLFTKSLSINPKKLLLSYNTNIGKFTKARIKVVRKQFKEVMYRITTNNGKSIVVSKYQPILTNVGLMNMVDMDCVPTRELKIRKLKKLRKYELATKGYGKIDYSPIAKIISVAPQFTYEVRTHKTYYTFLVDGFILGNLKGKYGEREKNQRAGALARARKKAAETSSRIEEAASAKGTEKPNPGNTA